MKQLKLFLNISKTFNPGMETIGSYLIEQGQRLIEIGTRMNKEDSSDLKQTVKDSDTDWETEGSY